MSTTVAMNKGDWVGTKQQYISLSSIEANKKYYITDLETFVITNSAMASALTTYSSLYNVGDIFLCIDSGTYSQNTFYKFDLTSWVNLGQLVSSSEKTAWNNKSDFSGSYTDLTDKPTIPTTTDSVTQGSTAALTSGGAYTALSGKQDSLPTTSTAGKVLQSTSTSGVVEWADQVAATFVRWS